MCTAPYLFFTITVHISTQLVILIGRNMTAPYDIDTSTETTELLETARLQLRETPENREKGFRELRELLLQSPDLKFREDDDFLEVILRCCHWYPEGAIKLVRVQTDSII